MVVNLAITRSWAKKSHLLSIAILPNKVASFRVSKKQPVPSITFVLMHHKATTKLFEPLHPLKLINNSLQRILSPNSIPSPPTMSHPALVEFQRNDDMVTSHDPRPRRRSKHALQQDGRDIENTSS